MSAGTILATVAAILPTASRDYNRPCEIIYDAQSGSKSMRVASSLLHWGCVTVNTAPNMVEVIFIFYVFPGFVIVSHVYNKTKTATAKCSYHV